jgi:hypothetical protein
MKTFLTLFILLVSAIENFSAAQDAKDSASLKSFFKKGNFSFNARTFFMNTLNEGVLKDDAALAAGAGIRYETPVWKGFSAAMGGFFIYNIVSTNLTRKDSLSGQKNRYEIGLFDITDPTNKTELDRLEELYIRYHFKQISLIAGRQFINTPFINKQDGRMRPTSVEAISIKSSIKNKWLIDAIWIKRVSPRTTVSWYNIGESVGIYSPGVNPDGTKSTYPGNTFSKFVLVNGIQFKNEKLQVQLWNTYVENISNTILFQPEYKFLITNKSKLLTGLQFIYQNASGNGGNENISKTYYEPGNHTWIIGSRFGFEHKNWKADINYIHMSSDYRFLIPREWGREPFYTFMARERNEGLGNVNGFKLNYEILSKNKQWKFSLAYGRYNLPPVNDYRLNKYGMPSYQQLNFQTDYQFTGFLKNFDLQMLLAWKGNIAKQNLQPSNIINKVNMLNTNFVVNYHF